MVIMRIVMRDAHKQKSVNTRTTTKKKEYKYSSMRCERASWLCVPSNTFYIREHMRQVYFSAPLRWRLHSLTYT